jgi:hypothetical protein
MTIGFAPWSYWSIDACPALGKRWSQALLQRNGHAGLRRQALYLAIDEVVGELAGDSGYLHVREYPSRL